MNIKMIILCSISLLSACQSQVIKNVVGEYVYGHEVETFTPCHSEKTYWVDGADSELEKVRNKVLMLTKMNKKPYQSVYVKLDYADLGKDTEGFAAEYDSVIKVKNVMLVEKCD
ncbi:hypothetical protein [Pasteurella multocida]|uniref:hypothetical protein n=1 Tax=Pasteurella multocida TaxID=747 RepID=UPI00244B4C09|nr:hypothetical protein [Pasteurella multocida]MDH3003329.1 hypothetical protein [Pasteurella multocida]